MPRPVSLLFGVHAHQPVGNFPEVLARRPSALLPAFLLSPLPLSAAFVLRCIFPAGYWII